MQHLLHREMLVVGMWERPQLLDQQVPGFKLVCCPISVTTWRLFLLLRFSLIAQTPEKSIQLALIGT